jgi:hypothetical protein
MTSSGLGAILLLAGSLHAAPPRVTSVRQAPPPEVVQQMRLGLIQPPAPGERPPTYPVARYEKLELRIGLEATFRNPYDPEEVDLWAEFTSPSGKLWKIWGFYNPSNWNALWMVRFSPSENGRWRYVVKVRDREGTAASKPAEVTVVESRHHGFVGIAENHRYLRFSDGTPFYGVGLWYNDNYEQYNNGVITEEGLDALRQHGANFISFYSGPLETLGTGLGRYDENRAGRLDQIFEWCEKRDIQISWNIWFHSYYSESIWGGGNARYANNPYRAVTAAEDFFKSADAWNYTEKVYRYMLARWGYSRALFLWFVVDEINGTEAWMNGGSDAGEVWCRKVHDWLKASDPYGRPTTGTQSGGIKQWWPAGYQIFDIAAREIYEAQGHPFPQSGKPDPASENPLRISYLNYAKQTQDLWSGFVKPAIVGECGYDHTFYEPGMPGYLAMYHNALWAGLANGLAATPFWWSNGPYTGDSVLTRTMLYFSQFVRDIDFTRGPWKPVKLEVSGGDGWALVSDGRTFGWVVNPLNGVANETFRVPGLDDGRYEVRLYRTWRGQYLDPISANTTGGVVTVKIPELRPNGGRAQQTGDDIAFKITRVE